MKIKAVSIRLGQGFALKNFNIQQNNIKSSTRWWQSSSIQQPLWIQNGAILGYLVLAPTAHGHHGKWCSCLPKTNTAKVQSKPAGPSIHSALRVLDMAIKLDGLTSFHASRIVSSLRYDLRWWLVCFQQHGMVQELCAHF